MGFVIWYGGPAKGHAIGKYVEIFECEMVMLFPAMFLMIVNDY